MMPLLTPLIPPTAPNGPSPGAEEGLPGPLLEGQLSDLEGVSGSFEATLAGLDEVLPAGLAALVGRNLTLAGEGGQGGHGLPGGGKALPPGAAGVLPGALAVGQASAGHQGWQPGELVALLAAERGLAAPGAARGEAGSLPGLVAGMAAELPASPGAQAQGLLARLDGLLALEPPAGGSSARGQAAGGAGSAAAALLAGQSPLVPDSPGFGRGLGQRLIAMVQQGLQQAQLRIHPEHLGPMDVRLRMEGEAVQVTLASPHASVREALESALPRLRESLAEHGLSLAEAEVGGGERQSAGRGEGDESSDHAGTGGQAGAGGPDTGAEVAGDGSLTPRALSLVDTFA